MLPEYHLPLIKIPFNIAKNLAILKYDHRSRTNVELAVIKGPTVEDAYIIAAEIALARLEELGLVAQVRVLR